MTLTTYNKKRNFTITPEPSADSTIDPAESNCFVVQKHLASHLHYDFRLALNGVLKSWAIPKGPSLNPKDKRLAIATEDHPLAYAKFEGIIPAGEYGGGIVMVWDYGTWSTVDDPEVSLAQGKLQFQLTGQKLRGTWTLLQLKPDPKNWLLIKSTDAYTANSTVNSYLLNTPSALTGKAMEEIN